MKYVLNMIKVLSLAIAGCLLYGFVYFSITKGENHAIFAHLSLLLLVFSLLISALSVVFCENIQDEKAKQQIFAKILRNLNGIKNTITNYPLDSKQLNPHLKTEDEKNDPSLLNYVRSLDLKMDNYNRNAADQNLLLSGTLSDLKQQILNQGFSAADSTSAAHSEEKIIRHIDRLEQQIKKMTSAARMAGAFDTEKYSAPQEEASYPESVMNLQDTKPAFDPQPFSPDETTDAPQKNLEDLIEDNAPNPNGASDRLKTIFNDQLASEIADLDLSEDDSQVNENQIQPQDINLNDFLK